MAPVVQKLEQLLRDGEAYVSDGHVLCAPDAGPANPFDYDVPFHLKKSEFDVLLWTPHTVLGVRADRCLAAPWSAGHPTINATRLAEG